MDKKLTYKGAVMTWECDSNAHMNIMYYVNKYENAGRNFSLEMGFMDIMENTGFVVVEQVIRYLKEAFEDDLIYIESHLVKFSNKAIFIKHEMYNGKTKEKLSEMEVVIVLFNKVTRKAIAIPDDKRAVLEGKIFKG